MKIDTGVMSRSTIATILLITGMTMWSEVSKGFNNFLASLTGHHWTAKGMIAVVFFVLLYSIFSKTCKECADINKEIDYVIGTTVVCTLIIFAFFIWHYFA